MTNLAKSELKFASRLESDSDIESNAQAKQDESAKETATYQETRSAEDDHTKVLHNRICMFVPSPAEFPFFYGYVVVFCGLIGHCMVAIGSTTSFGAIMGRILNDLEEQTGRNARSMVSSAYSVGSFGGAVFTPIIGYCMDRFGMRMMNGVLLLTFCGSMALLSLCQDFYSFSAVFILSRMSSVGGVMMVTTTAVSKWFITRRGRVLGIMTVASAIIGGSGVPVLSVWGAEQWGWRRFFQLYSAACALSLVPLAYIGVRNSPEECGILPDGIKGAKQSGELAASDSAPENDSDQEQVQTKIHEPEYSPKEALRTPVFFSLICSTFLYTTAQSGLFLHLSTILSDQELGEHAIALVYGPFGFVIAGMALMSGWAMDKVRPQLVISSGLLVQMAAVLCLCTAKSDFSAVLFGVFAGMNMGILMTAYKGVIAKLFGRKCLGRTQGILRAVQIFGTSVGPMLLGTIRDKYGKDGMQSMMWAMIPALGAASLLVFLTPSPPIVPAVKKGIVKHRQGGWRSILPRFKREQKGKGSAQNSHIPNSGDEEAEFGMLRNADTGLKSVEEEVEMGSVKT